MKVSIDFHTEAPGVADHGCATLVVDVEHAQASQFRARMPVECSVSDIARSLISIG